MTGFCFVGFFTPPTGAVVALVPTLRFLRPARCLRFVFLSPIMVSRDLSTLADIVNEVDEVVLVLESELRGFVRMIDPKPR